MEKKEKLLRISEEIALRKAGKFISVIYRGDKIMYPPGTEKTRAEENFGIADIRRV